MVDLTSSLTFTGFVNNAIARDPDVTGLLFTLKKGSVSGPYTGKYNVYVAIIDNITEPPKQEDFTALKNQLLSSYSNRVANGIFEAMKKNAEIKDSRAKFY